MAERSLDELARDLASDGDTEVLDDEGDPEMRPTSNLAALELERRGAESTPIFVAALDGPAVGAVNACWSLAKRGKEVAHVLPKLVDAWWRVSGDHKRRVQDSILRLCRSAPPASAAEALIVLAGGSDRYARLALVHALRDLGGVGYEAACILAADPIPDVAASAMKELADILKR